MGILVICSYMPKDGGEAELIELLKKHGPTLRGEGLITDRPTVLLRSEEGAYLEIFEWRSEEASRGAHANEAVGPIWTAMAEVCDFIPLSSLEQTKTPFAHFEPIVL